MEETIESKVAFEKYAAAHGIQILHYHADNGVFRANDWIKSYQSGPHQQGLTFAGVDAHHTNGLAECRIQDIQDNRRAMLLHAAHKWKTHVTANLWPYALCTANHAYNNTPLLDNPEGKTPTQNLLQPKSRTIQNIGIHLDALLLSISNSCALTIASTTNGNHIVT